MRNTPDPGLSTAMWIKSSYSGGGNNCLEIAPGHPALVPVRDSKNPEGPNLLFRPEAWSAFVSGLKP